MCIENYPECGDGGDGCCELKMGIAVDYLHRARKRIPQIRARKVDFQLYALWSEVGGKRISDCIEACCPTCARAEFIFKHVRDKGLDELNKLISLPDTRTLR